MEKTQETFIGIDVSKAYLDVHSLPSSEAWQADNTPGNCSHPHPLR